MVKIDALTFSYPSGDFRLRVPAMSLGPGERLAIVGPSGSGKTTLLNLIAGLLRPDTGRIEVVGINITALTAAERRHFRARQFGFVFQDFALLDYLSARQNILYPYRIGSAMRQDGAVRARAEALADAAGVADKLDRYPADLSRGEQQRVAICRALVTQPKVILCDEATGNLDTDNKRRVLDLLFAQADVTGAGVLAVTHDHELLPHFDRVLDFAAFREARVA